MAKYLVHAKIGAEVTVEVEAESEDEAESLAYDEIRGCNFDAYNAYNVFDCDVRSAVRLDK